MRAKEGNMTAVRVPATSADGIILQMIAARRACPADEGHRGDGEMRAAHARQPCECGAADRDRWHYICRCPRLADARARLADAAAAAEKAFAGDAEIEV
jgi:hypothetical protein